MDSDPLTAAAMSARERALGAIDAAVAATGGVIGAGAEGWSGPAADAYAARTAELRVRLVEVHAALADARIDAFLARQAVGGG